MVGILFIYLGWIFLPHPTKIWLCRQLKWLDFGMNGKCLILNNCDYFTQIKFFIMYSDCKPLRPIINHHKDSYYSKITEM